MTEDVTWTNLGESIETAKGATTAGITEDTTEFSWKNALIASAGAETTASHAADIPWGIVSYPLVASIDATTSTPV